MGKLRHSQSMGDGRPEPGDGDHAHWSTCSTCHRRVLLAITCHTKDEMIPDNGGVGRTVWHVPEWKKLNVDGSEHRCKHKACR